MENLYDANIKLIEKYSDTHPNITNLWKNVIMNRKNNYEALLKRTHTVLNKLELFDKDITDKDIMTLFILFNGYDLNIKE